MIVMFGTRLYGKVDHVPGLFYVATMFGYINFVPLVPTESWLVFDDGAERGIKIRMSGLSVLVGWLRPVLLLAGGVGLLFAVIAAAEGDPRGGYIDAIIFGLAGLCSLGLLAASYRFIRIGRDRAVRIAEDAGLNPELVHRHFDRLDGRDLAELEPVEENDDDRYRD